MAHHERITRVLAADQHVGSVVVIEVKGEILNENKEANNDTISGAFSIVC